MAIMGDTTLNRNSGVKRVIEIGERASSNGRTKTAAALTRVVQHQHRSANFPMSRTFVCLAAKWSVHTFTFILVVFDKYFVD